MVVQSFRFEQESTMTMANNSPNLPKQPRNWLPWLGGLLVIMILAVLWTPLSKVGANSLVIRAWIERMGPFAPLVFFLLNVAQIVLAPIPGYPVQALGGVLFGLIPGSIYTVAGLTAGGTLAAWLGRRLGRPWLEKRMGRETLERWSRMAHINSFWTWWLVLLLPIGDIPYFFAGLSRIRLSTFALAILTSRGPFTVLIVWLGDSAVNLPLTWMALSMVAVVLVVIVGFSQAGRLEAWGRSYLQRYAAGETKESS
ncbi:MAG: TVP38/TMEM64 family protein [Chloroflexota bacterium]